MTTVVYNLDRVVSITKQERKLSGYYKYVPTKKYLFGLITTSEHIEDTIFGKCYSIDTFLDENEEYILVGKTLYVKPCVTVRLTNKEYTTKYFDTLQEADRWFDSIQIKTPLTINA